MKNYITFTRDSFATKEDWDTVLEEVGAPVDDSVYSVTIYFDSKDADINYYEG